MSNQEKTWWRKLEKPGDYIMLTPSGRRGVANAWDDLAGELWFLYSFSVKGYVSKQPEPDCLFYGPFEDGEIFDALWSELPAPPARLPKSHPERFLGKVGTYSDHFIVVCGAADKDDHVPIQELNADWNVCIRLGSVDVTHGRYAQQGLDGIWHEVDASEDPRAQQVEADNA